MARQSKTEYELELNELESEGSGIQRDAVPCFRNWDSMPMEGVLNSEIGI